MLIISRRFRQFVANILCIPFQLDESSKSLWESGECLDLIKQFALTLDSFIKELTIFTSNLIQKEKKLNVDDFKKF